MKLSDLTRGKWREILLSFGVPERVLNGKHQPCPFCGGEKRFRWTNRNQDGVFFCNHCGSGSGFEFLMRFTKQRFEDLAPEIQKRAGGLQPDKPKPKGNPSRRLYWIKKRIIPVKKCPPVMAYLSGRDLKPSKYIFALEKEKYYADGAVIAEYPTMAVPFYNPKGILINWHLTYTQDGQKAQVSSPKKLICPLGEETGALRLTGIYPEIGVAEGVETALAIMRDFKIPCWALYSAGMMEKFIPPKSIKSVIIFGDNDVGFDGQKAAYILAWRLKRLGYDVDVKIYPEIGKDFADATI